MKMQRREEVSKATEGPLTIDSARAFAQIGSYLPSESCPFLAHFGDLRVGQLVCPLNQAKWPSYSHHNPI